MTAHWRSPAAQRRIDPLVAAVWSAGVVGAVLTVVGAITAAKWRWHLATGLRG